MDLLQKRAVMPTGQLRGQHAMQCPLGRAQSVLVAVRIEPGHDLAKSGDIIARKAQAPVPNNRPLAQCSAIKSEMLLL